MDDDDAVEAPELEVAYPDRLRWQPFVGMGLAWLAGLTEATEAVLTEASGYLYGAGNHQFIQERFHAEAAQAIETITEES